MTVADIQWMVAVFNPKSGGGQFRKDLPLMVDLLESFGLHVEQRPTERPGHAAELAAQAAAAGAAAGCALGGGRPGHAVLDGIPGTDVPLSIVPAGTVNVLAAELGIPLEPADACRLVGSGHLSWIDLGKAGDRWFALMAGVGMDAAVVQSINPMLKKVLREAAFAVQGAATVLKGDFPRIRVVTDEQTVEGYFAVLGNSSNYGGAFGITPMASMRDGLLDVCVLQSVSPLSTLQYWLGALVQSHVRQPHVQYWRTQAAQIDVAEGEGDVLVQTDGEMAGRLPIEVRVVPRALKVIVP